MFSFFHSSFGGQLRRRRQVIGMLTFLRVFCKKGSCPIPLSISFLLWLPMRVPDSHRRPSGKTNCERKLTVRLFRRKTRNTGKSMTGEHIRWCHSLKYSLCSDLMLLAFFVYPIFWPFGRDLPPVREVCLQSLTASPLSAYNVPDILRLFFQPRRSPPESSGLGKNTLIVGRDLPHDFHSAAEHAWFFWRRHSYK